MSGCLACSLPRPRYKKTPCLPPPAPNRRQAGFVSGGRVAARGDGRWGSACSPLSLPLFSLFSLYSRPISCFRLTPPEPSALSPFASPLLIHQLYILLSLRVTQKDHRIPILSHLPLPPLLFPLGVSLLLSSHLCLSPPLSLPPSLSLLSFSLSLSPSLPPSLSRCRARRTDTTQRRGCGPSARDSPVARARARAHTQLTRRRPPSPPLPSPALSPTPPSFIGNLSPAGSMYCMAALSLGWLGALCATCYHFNGSAAFSRTGVSGELFSFGGVYGHKRPITEVRHQYVAKVDSLSGWQPQLTVALCLIGDLEYDLRFVPRACRARRL